VVNQMTRIDQSMKSDSLRQRAAGLVLGLLCSAPLATPVARANDPAQTPSVSSPAAPAAAAAGSTSTAGGQKPLAGRVSNTVHRNLERGPLLLSPQQNTLVETPYGTVSVSAGSVALIISADNGLSVYNLHDTHKNAVVVNYGKKPLSLMPECMAVVAKSSFKTFEEVNPAPFVAYRQVVGHDVSAETKLYQAEFNFESMVRGLPQLRKLMDSKIGAQRKTMGDMLKTGAIMTQLSQSSEPYGYYVTQHVRDVSAAAKP
jgi:hypothetical protein